MKVLVIDDEPIVLETARTVLEGMGYEVGTRLSAMGASAWIMRENPDVVLIDVAMPALSGDAWLEMVAERDPSAGESPPVFILFSGAPPEELERLVKESCAAGYIEKASGPEGFERAFRRIVRGAFQ